jgi:hypothetical protein
MTGLRLAQDDRTSFRSDDKSFAANDISNDVHHPVSPKTLRLRRLSQDDKSFAANDISTDVHHPEPPKALRLRRLSQDGKSFAQDDKGECGSFVVVRLAA